MTSSPLDVQSKDSYILKPISTSITSQQSNGNFVVDAGSPLPIRIDGKNYTIQNDINAPVEVVGTLSDEEKKDYFKVRPSPIYALTLGIIATIGGVLICGIPAIVLGVLTMRRVENEEALQRARVMSKVGALLGYAGFFVALLWPLALLNLVFVPS